MCLMCIELQKGLISPNEFVEKINLILKEDPEHEEELIEALKKADDKYLDNLDKFLQEKLSKNLIDFF